MAALVLYLPFYRRRVTSWAQVHQCLA
jgi:hypothetical protein